MRIEGDDQRLDWPDVAKALCIILVVLLHVSTALGQGHWNALNIALHPLRMPLFFLVSGLLASNSIIHPSDDTAHKRFCRPLYLYLLWGTILSALIPFQFPSDFPDHPLVHIGLTIALIAAASWYMLALAVFYLFAKMSLRMPLVPLLILCAALSLLGTLCQDGLIANQSKLFRCLIFFVAGVRMKEQWMHFASAASLSNTFILGVGFLFGSIVLHDADTWTLPVDLVAVAFGVSLCQMISVKWPAMMAQARWISRRTLPIYLIHFIILEIIVRIVAANSASVLVNNSHYAIAFPIMMTPVILKISVMVHDLLLGLKMRWLFDLPFGRPASLASNSRALVG